jgi:hypothetical protein
VKIRIVSVHNKWHGGKRKLSSIHGIVMHETEGYNGGDYAVLAGKTKRHVSVHFWIPDYNDAGAAKYIHGDTYDVFQFLPLTVTGWSVGNAVANWGNENTISIEMGNYKTEAYGEPQLEALDLLLAHIDGKMGKDLPIKSHATIALPKGRKTDPGRTFPMANYIATRTHHPVPPKPVTPPPVTPPVVKTKTVKASYLNMRPEPSTNRKPIHILRKGEKVQVLSGSSIWVRVKHGDLIGYVSDKYIG